MPRKRPQKKSRPKRLDRDPIVQSLAPLLVRVAKKAAKISAAGARIRSAPKPDPQPVPVPLSAKSLIGDVKPLRGPKRISPTAPVTRAPTTRGRSARAGVDRAPVTARAFVVQREEAEVVGYREDLGPSALSAFDARRFRPARQVDLHGQHTHGFEARVARTLLAFHETKVRTVLVIHGKGLHSPGGEGVLLELLISALTTGAAAAVVRAFRTAPGRLGGSGALLVVLER